MPSGESKHGNNIGNGNNNNSGSHVRSSRSSDRQKYCLLCDRNDFQLESLDASIIATIETLYKINVN